MRSLTVLAICVLSGAALAKGATEFCLDGELDLGARLQGLTPLSGEFYPTTWCVITEDDSNRVWFSGAGKSNPDMDGDWTVAYLPPDLVRIVNRNSPPDIEFNGTDNADEALRVRRIDPRRFSQELDNANSKLRDVVVERCGSRIQSVKTTTSLPLRGDVDVEWRWDWDDVNQPRLRLIVDNELLFSATGRWRDIDAETADALWQATQGSPPIEVPGDRWPARIAMQLNKLTDGVYLVSGVRTGFQHLVVETDAGLVVGDAPAGWVEFHQIPPGDLVPGMGVSGLSEKLIDFLSDAFPGQRIAAVALTHFHDDHAGGARAFASAGARIYAAQESAGFLQTALNRTSMPNDRQTKHDRPVVVAPVRDAVVIGSKPNRVKLISIGAGPHANAMLGVWAIDKNYFFVSDIHVPRSDADAPREERARTECWFANWAVENLPSDVLVANTHSSPLTPVERLARYLRSDLCSE